MSDEPEIWGELSRPGPDSVHIAGVQVRRGSRVVLRPRAGGDILDEALNGRTGIVEGIEEEVGGALQIAVTVDDDPGRDFGDRRQPGHRFFFTPGEIEPMGEEVGARVLVAGIGNVFLGDDGFGVALAGLLGARPTRPGVDVVDFGIRGMDLAYALDAYDVVVLLDAVPHGEAPGTLYVIEPELGDAQASPDAHGMDPMTVLALARTLGSNLPRTLVVGCEPLRVMSGDEDELVGELSAPVTAALEPAAELVETLLSDLMNIDAKSREVTQQ